MDKYCTDCENFGSNKPTYENPCGDDFCRLKQIYLYPNDGSDCEEYKRKDDKNG